MPVKCPQCGSICKDNARFCETCGTGLTVAAQGERPVSPSGPSGAPLPEPSPLGAHAGFLDYLWRIPFSLLFFGGSVFAVFMAGGGLGAALRIGSGADEAINFGVVFFFVGLLAVFLLTRVSSWTWFRYFGIYFAVMFIGALIDPNRNVPLDTYLVVVAGVGLILGLVGLRRGRKRFARRTGGAIWGRVTDIQPRHQSIATMTRPSVEVLEFRLQETGQDFQEIIRDAQQNPRSAYSVEIRAKEISGSLQNGDKVMIEGSSSNGILYAKRVVNQTTQSELKIKGSVGAP